MKTEGAATSNDLTRRSFIKRSVVAAVAASSLTIFSGLVNAAEDSDYCEIRREDRLYQWQNGYPSIPVSYCWATNYSNDKYDCQMTCGNYIPRDRNGDPKRDDNGKLVLKPRTVYCILSKEDAERLGIWCLRETQMV